MLRVTSELGKEAGNVCLRRIDVHRERSQLAVIDAEGEVLVHRNVPNGVEPILKVIGGLPPGTPAAFEAAFGAGWLMELLEGFQVSLFTVADRAVTAVLRGVVSGGSG
jgi:hypothetical protein